MNYIISVIVFLSLGISALFCQEQYNNNSTNQPGSVFELLDVINQISTAEQLNISFTEQDGANNKLNVYSQAGLSEINIVAVGQYGNSNEGIIKQKGLDQQVGLYQNGNQNKANLTVTGKNIFNVVTQVGNENYVEQDIDNGTSTNLKTVSSEQYGNSNSIVLQTAMDYSSIEVVQNGNNNNAELDFSSSGTQTEPYRVEQTGNDGEVVINYSDFYMPMQSGVQ